MGLEYARQLAEKGYDLILVSNRQDELDSAVKSLSNQFQVSVRGRFQDLALPLSADELYDWCKREGVLPDILINNAGMFFFKELEAADMDRVQAMVNLHVCTVTRLCLLFWNGHEGTRQRAHSDSIVHDGTDPCARHHNLFSYKGLSQEFRPVPFL